MAIDSAVPETPRDQFVRVYQQLQALRADHQEKRRVLTLHYEQALDLFAREYHPTAKDPVAKLAQLRPMEANAFKEPWAEQARNMAADQKAERDQLEKVLDDLAPQAQPLPGEFKLYDSVHRTVYQSTGRGDHYAKVRAALSVAEVMRSGMPVEARESGSGSYEVWVGVADVVDLEILRRRPGLPLKDWVRFCWKHQAQPRVFNPYLKPGYEEEVGLDYFGGDKEPVAAKPETVN